MTRGHSSLNEPRQMLQDNFEIYPGCRGGSRAPRGDPPGRPYAAAGRPLAQDQPRFNLAVPPRQRLATR